MVPTPATMLRSVLPTSVSFFFSSRRRHTRSLCDWSSDVCSSDLVQVRRIRHESGGGDEQRDMGDGILRINLMKIAAREGQAQAGVAQVVGVEQIGDEIGRAAGRGRGEISGGAGSFKKKKKKKKEWGPSTKDRHNQPRSAKKKSVVKKKKSRRDACSMRK